MADLHDSPARQASERSRSGQAIRQLLLVGLLTLLFILPTVGAAVRAKLAHPPAEPSWIVGDVDTGLIMEGLRNTKGFGDTLRWWTGSWVGIVPFYRPLTSYLFWVEWKAFGVDEPAYLYPAIALHVAATLMFAGFAWAVAHRFGHPWPVAAGAMAGVAFGGIPGTPRLGVAALVYLQWKNQPDAAAAFFALGALWLYLRSIEGRRGALLGAMGLYLAACGFKEIAVPLPAICLALEPDLRVWRGPALRRVAAMGAVGVGFLIVRFLALRGLGYTYGSNDAVVTRTLIALLGPFGALALGNWLVPTAVLTSAATLFAAIRLRSRTTRARVSQEQAESGPRLGWVAWFVGWLAIMGWLGCIDIVRDGGRELSDLFTAAGWSTGVMHLGYTAYANHVELMVLVLVMVAFMARYCRRGLGFGVAWVILLLLPLTLSPGPIHRHYLPEGGYMLIAGLALTWLPALPRLLRERTGQSMRSAIN